MASQIQGLREIESSGHDLWASVAREMLAGSREFQTSIYNRMLSAVRQTAPVKAPVASETAGPAAMGRCPECGTRGRIGDRCRCSGERFGENMGER